jgi:hypothetical protein
MVPARSSPTHTRLGSAAGRTRPVSYNREDAKEMGELLDRRKGTFDESLLSRSRQLQD